jgi:hypothetical protein
MVILLNGNGMSLGKGVIRYSRPEYIDFDVVEMILKATQESTGVICSHNEFHSAPYIEDK